MLSEPVTTTKPTELGPAVELQPKEEMFQKKPDAVVRTSEDAQLLQDVLEVVKQHFHISNVGLNFSVHGDTGRIKVSVTDKETGEMIREIPSEQVLNLMAKLDEMMGIILDEKA